MVWFAMVILAMSILVVLQYYTFREYNEIRAFKESDFLISETEKIIAENDADLQELHTFLKKLYLEKAEAAACIIDSSPESEMDSQKFKDLAETIGVDQIHLFDADGVIYNGTNPEYYGLSMDAGEQIGFFKPMLSDRGMSLSQDISPNTAEGRVMLYAMCWNKDGTRLVQVGAYGERFPRLLNRNRIDMFLDLVPDDPTSDIMLTDIGSEIIIASTNKELVGKRLTDIGIHVNGELTENQIDFKTGFSNHPIYCSAKQHRDFHIYIAQYQEKIDKNIPVTIFTFAEYLTLVFIAMSFVIDYYYDKFIQEKAYAMKDKLTGLYSRRAYEMRLDELGENPLNEDLVFVSMDVNGLKICNDTLGHQAGDTLLKGAAECMMQCFGPVGQVYRFGGDEFAAIIIAKGVEIIPLKEYLSKLCSQWSSENHINMSVSIGFSRSSDYPDAAIHSLEAIADQEMYADKSRYYSKAKHNRRGVSDESK